MNIDLIGRIKNTKLAARHGLMPLYEAAVNSIMAIEESQRADGYIRIAIERDLKQSELDLHGNTIAPVEAFVIEDNGIGFTESNFRSFETMDSQEKAARGAKGIGRLLWLKLLHTLKLKAPIGKMINGIIARLSLDQPR
jgi:hypothetical protein